MGENDLLLFSICDGTKSVFFFFFGQTIIDVCCYSGTLLIEKSCHGEVNKEIFYIKNILYLDIF